MATSSPLRQLEVEVSLSLKAQISVEVEAPEVKPPVSLSLSHQMAKSQRCRGDETLSKIQDFTRYSEFMCLYIARLLGFTLREGDGALEEDDSCKMNQHP